MKVHQRVISALLGAALFATLAGCSGMSATPETSAAPIKDARALSDLKAMSDVLAKAGAMRFRADSTVAIASPTGQWVHVFGTSQVTLQRPDKLYVETRGDLFAQDFYYDGKTVTMYAPAEKLYATQDVPGTLDETLIEVFQKSGTYFSFADVIQSIPHDALAKDVTSAQVVGQSVVGGELTQHLAFASPTLEWEIWIGESDNLPRLLSVTYIAEKGRPTCSVAFVNWQLNPAIPAERFTFTPPAGASRIDFHKIEPPAMK